MVSNLSIELLMSLTLEVCSKDFPVEKSGEVFQKWSLISLIV